MISDGIFCFTWDGENRLICASNANHVVSYAYDSDSRLIGKTTDGRTHLYGWDGFHRLHETDEQSTRWNIWGLDLFGSERHAGGVGALIAVCDAGHMCHAAYDGNGNISEFVSTNGSIVVHNEYLPWGDLSLSETSNQFTESFGWSSKPLDSTTGLIEYQLRMYSPSYGRWINRDPICDYAWKTAPFWMVEMISPDALSRNEANPYIQCNNDTINGVDAYGLDEQRHECVWTIYAGHWDWASETIANLETPKCGERLGAVSCHRDLTNKAIKDKFGSDYFIEGIPEDPGLLWPDDSKKRPEDGAKMTEAIKKAFDAARELQKKKCRYRSCCESITISIVCQDKLEDFFDRYRKGINWCTKPPFKSRCGDGLAPTPKGK